MDGNENRLVGISRQDWSLERRASRDEARHNEKVKEAIKDNLDSVVSDGAIITADPRSKRIVKVPMKALELPRFKYGKPEDGVGTGTGEGQPKPGDQVGDGNEAGTEPGEEYYESEMTIDEIQKMVFEDLELPNIKPRQNPVLEHDQDVFNDIRHKRTPNNIHLGRTVMQNILRNAQETGEAKVAGISTEDFRVRTWEQEKKPENNAVVIAMADISGSMGDFEKYITRAFCWWSVNFLRSKYPKVDIVFVAHDTEAYEVSEEQFFSRGSGGGTKCSSANKMALNLIMERYQTSQYNVYPLHFSDGDNYTEDNKTCVDLVHDILDQDISQYAYIQINSYARGVSQLLKSYQDDISDQRFKGLVINKKEDILEALKAVFSNQEEAA
jgi:sporulation protein YhbH